MKGSFRLKNQEGMTLLEVMLVIVVISMLTVSGIMYFQVRTENIKIDKAAFQIQEILQASINFYIDKKVLPAEDLSNLKPDYLPAAYSFENPWGEPYQRSTTLAPGQFFAIETKYTKETQANQLKGLLPSIFIDKDKKLLTAAVPLTNQVKNTLDTIRYANIVKPNEVIPKPICDKALGLSPQIFVVPAVFSSGKEAYPLSLVGAYADPSADDNPNWTVRAVIKTANPAITPDQSYTRLLVITRCIQAENLLQSSTTTENQSTGTSQFYF